MLISKPSNSLLVPSKVVHSMVMSTVELPSTVLLSMVSKSSNTDRLTFLAICSNSVLPVKNALRKLVSSISKLYQQILEYQLVENLSIFMTIIKAFIHIFYLFNLIKFNVIASVTSSTWVMSWLKLLLWTSKPLVNWLQESWESSSLTTGNWLKPTMKVWPLETTRKLARLSVLFLHNF